ncbi:Serine/threonine-protein kinase PknB [Rubripirellula lacrimiformis]|uniref:non-specific serine/threonine protein kinase n=1 Tax=Rubripirellula lacrimiformis TaxID=1930273 RepID=A0A517NJ47_9BACT|nr:serine/threonine-protein kinase [Rubripirellula lacrimiformis]QDT07160.1 Serine/threonine-protein kinase PknB [Rubripirellula lacrimiformis]
MIPYSSLADYELGEVLGVGTVGTIYSATEKASGNVVALKKLHPAVSQDATIRARFEREMLILSRLRHPNIIAYHSGGDDHGTLFYVMEMVRGGTVKDLLESDGRFQWPVVVELGRQICSALQYAHNYGVIHRDLKPGNLFLTRDGTVKLGDFGIARDLHNADLTNSGMTVGTHAYMAPEQITGDASISGKADLYALGCCLYEMLVGRKPFNGENFAQLFEQHLRTPPPRVRDAVPDCPAELDNIVHQLLAKRPEDRPFNARSVQAVMLQLDESQQPHLADTDAAGPHPTAPHPIDRDSPTDVAAELAGPNQQGSRSAAAAATFDSPGRRLLVDQIRDRGKGMADRSVSWTRLAILGGAIVLGIVIALLVSRMQ